MSILDNAKKPQKKTPIITLCGQPGTGKTTLAATFPQPAFLIQTTGENLPDDISEENEPKSLGVTDSYRKLMQQISALIKDDHDYKTVIIDSVTGLETIFIAEIIAESNAKSINSAAGGFGAGRSAVAARHMKVREAVEHLRNKGIYVIFIAHSDIVTISPPDNDPYGQWSLRLYKDSIAPYVDNVDVVGLIKSDIAVIGEDGAKRKRALGGEDFTLVCTTSASAVAKNRLGITQDLPITKGVNPLAKYLGLPYDEPEVVQKAEVQPEHDDIDFN